MPAIEEVAALLLVPQCCSGKVDKSADQGTAPPGPLGLPAGCPYLGTGPTSGGDEGAMIAASRGERPLPEEQVLGNGAQADAPAAVQQLIGDGNRPGLLLQVEG